MIEKGYKKKQYSTEFKLKIIKLRLEGISLKKLVTENNISSTDSIRDWIKKYKESGIEGLKSKRELANNSKHNYSKTKFLSLEEELAYTKLENEYLKKKILENGESPIFIANLWSSKNQK